MEKKKTMIINCDICDTRKLQEGAYEDYDEVVINADFIFVDERSKVLLEKLRVTCNADEFIEIDSDAASDIPIVTINGAYHIGNTVPAEDNIILCVNGMLEVEPGAEEALRHYIRISVNGLILGPESLSSYLSRVALNGDIALYPDDYTLLKSNFIIDKYFPLRASDSGKYFVRNTVKLLDKAVDVARLVEKKVRFRAKKLLVPEEKLEECVPLFDESTEFIVVPEGFSIVDGDAVLDDELIRKYGGRIFVYGDLDARKDIEKAVSQIEALIVTGKVTLTRGSEEEFKELNAECGKTEIVKGIVLGNNAAVTIHSDSLRLSDGISVRNCGTVTIAEDVMPEDIMRLLDMANIGIVRCSEAQATAVTAVTMNLGRIITEEAEDEEESEDKASDERVINADKYVM